MGAIVGAKVAKNIALLAHFHSKRGARMDGDGGRHDGTWRRNTPNNSLGKDKTPKFHTFREYFERH